MKDITIFFVGSFLFLALLAGGCIKLGYPEEDTYEVTNIERVDITHGDSDGFTTEPTYYVYTDKGVFLIELSGINAYSYGLQRLWNEVPGTYRMKTRGARLEWLGFYPNIIEIVEVDAILSPGINNWQLE